MKYLAIYLIINFLSYQLAHAYEVLPANTIHITDFNQDSIILKPISAEKAEDIVSYLKKKNYIPYKYYADACHVRTQEVSDLISFKYYNSQSIDVAKIAIEPKQETDVITYKSENSPWQLRWKYHMAPMINVEGELMVVDLTLFDTFVSVKTWHDEVLKNTTDLKKYRQFFMNRFTFRTSLKNQRFKQLPRKFDISMSGFISQFKNDFKLYGAYMQKCILQVEGEPDRVGGLLLSEVPESYDLSSLPTCFEQ